MPLKIGFVMDPIENINISKDTTFAMMLEAQKRGHEIHYIKMSDLYIEQGVARANTQILKVERTLNSFFEVIAEQDMQLGELDSILMRTDPPVDSEFIYATQMFSLAEAEGTLVVNSSSSLRDYNEKLFTSWFPELIPDTLVTCDTNKIKAFHKKHGTIICKPLDGMGGTSIFKVKEDGNNLGVVIETLTELGTRYAMFQKFMPEIKDGDKRILIVDGEVMPYCLARLPTGNETRGNLAAGGTGRPQPLSEKDFEIANKIASKMQENGLLFVGLDVIGDKVTEINITSPTCVQEIERAYNINICGKLFDAIEKRVVQ